MHLQTLTAMAVVVDPQRDSVAVAKQALPAGTHLTADNGSIVNLRQAVAPGHRFALHAVPAGEWVMQYGQPFALSLGLLPGDPITSETVENRVPQWDPQSFQVSPPVLAPWEGPLPTFDGFHRPDGRVGTRNWVLVVGASHCSSHVTSMIAMQAELSGLYTRAQYPNVDGVTGLAHGGGCGCPDMLPPDAPGRAPGGSVETLLRLIHHHLRHPNVGAALVIELGCEKTGLPALLGYTGQHPARSVPEDRQNGLQDWSDFFEKPVYGLSIQDLGGTRATIQKAMQLLPALLQAANLTRRAPAPASALGLALQCGGSDAFSGLTANPALGIASDLLVRAGGVSVISEIPEFLGAEHLFARRAITPEVAREIFAQMERYHAYAARRGASLTENPSPGNKAGGLINITIKSLGAMAKAGKAPVVGTLDYGQPYWEKGRNGLYLMYGPGYDPDCVPAQVATGCQVVCFTTGRGSVLGNVIAPVIKIASNSPMYQRMRADMDINAGAALDGLTSMDALGRAIFADILAVASGRTTQAEENGHREFTYWSEEGVTL
jgi:altronate hydrolase